jgi:methylglutaconyl-CoA hydratase
MATSDSRPAPVVGCAIVDDVATITLDSPANRNALSRALVADLHAALDTAESGAARVIVLTHTGNTFCAGADLKERASGPVDSTSIVDLFRRLMDSARPTIAAVDGFVRAGGVGLMASCDLVVVRPSADFAFTEVRIGAAPAMISVPIFRRCAASRLASPFLTGETFGAEHALAIGLVTDLADDVGARVRQLCESMLLGGPNALAATKQILRSVPGTPVDEAFGRMQQLSDALFESPEAAEGMQALLDKRPPAWSRAQVLRSAIDNRGRAR